MLHNGGKNRKDILEEETFSPNVTLFIIPPSVCSYQLPNTECQLIISQLYPDFYKKSFFLTRSGLIHLHLSFLAGGVLALVKCKHFTLVEQFLRAEAWMNVSS